MSEPVKIFCRKCQSKYDVSAFPPFTEFACPECGIILRTPKPFGRYLLEKLCTVSRSAEIYRAIDPVLQRRVAVKIADINGVLPGIKELFYAEVKLFAQISHAAIVPFYDCGTVGDKVFVVMQYMDGGDLGYHLKNGSLPTPDKLIDHMQNIASGLHLLQLGYKMVHHDVNPSNIMLTSAGEAKIGDFDLTVTQRPGNLIPGPTWGEIAYVSPERLRTGVEDHRGDIYSLGVTVYQLLSGRLPFESGAELPEILQHRSETFTELAALNPVVTPEISALVTAMLAPVPADRPQYPEIIRALHL